MKLNEKIHYYRTRAKLSQEELAAQVGVSRQAVSKWELGEATPEVAKLVQLARAFGVTTDELLSEEEPREESPQEEQANPSPEDSGVPGPSRWNGAAGLLHQLVRRYGWLVGVYIALGGLGLVLIGGLGRFMFQQMTATADDWFSSAGPEWDWYTSPERGYTIQIDPQWGGDLPPELEEEILSSLGIQPQSSSAFGGMGSVFLAIPTVILVIGIIITAAGAVLAVALYRKRNP